MSRPGGRAKGAVALAAALVILACAAAPARAVLPPNFGSLSSTERARLSHLLAAHFPAAWNARSASKAADVPTVLIADNFGKGKPPGLFGGKHYMDATVVGPGFVNSQLVVTGHGYHVAGIALGSFANDGTKPGMVTGALSRHANLFPVDGRDDDSLYFDPTKLTGSIRQAIADAPHGHVVVNTSVGHANDSNAAGDEAAAWIKKVRERGLEDDFFQAASAGNEGESGGTAGANSPFAAAAVRTDLMDGADPLPPLTNTLAVENATETDDVSALACLSPTSNTGGSVAAPGVEVWSFNENGGAENRPGTSQASPVVAGLGAYLWAIAPGLTPQQIASAIRENPQPPPIGGCTRGSAPRVDAYRATLSLDHAAAPSVAGYPVRMAILNVSGGKAFNDADVRELGSKVDVGKNPEGRTWSRSDLNGDGFAGGSGKTAFDLDRAGSTRAGASEYDTVHRGDGVLVDEQAVTDQDILCYYAFSPLYKSDAGPRNHACVEVEISPGQATLAPRHELRFSANVTGSSKKGVDWSASCGRISANGVYTAPRDTGRCRVTARSKVNSDRKDTATVHVQKAQGAVLIDERSASVSACGDPQTGAGGVTKSRPGKLPIEGIWTAATSESCTTAQASQTSDVEASPSGSGWLNVQGTTGSNPPGAKNSNSRHEVHLKAQKAVTLSCHGTFAGSSSLTALLIVLDAGTKREDRLFASTSTGFGENVNVSKSLAAGSSHNLLILMGGTGQSDSSNITCDFDGRVAIDAGN